MSEADVDQVARSELVPPLAPPTPHVDVHKPCGHWNHWEHDHLAAERKLVDARHPDSKNAGYSGLAFSGGGIRSATFGLGVLESLKAHGILHRFDYISSVSGGGYISAWLSANCMRRPNWLNECWKESIDHLRRYSNYLSPQVGFFSADTWSMLMVWLRNALLVQLTIILGIALLLLVPRLLFHLFEAWSGTHWPRSITVLLFVVSVVGICANMVKLHPGLRSRPEGKWSYSASGWLRWTILSLALFAAAGVLAVRYNFNPFTNAPIKPVAYPIGMLGMMASFSLVPFILRVVRPWRSEVGSTEINYGQGAVQLFIVIPMITTAFLLASVMWGLLDPAKSPAGMAHLKTYGALVREAGAYWPFPLALAFVAFLLLSFCSLKALKPAADGKLNQRKLATKALLSGFICICCAGVLHLMLSGIALMMQEFKPVEGGIWHAFVLGPALLLLAFSLAVNLMIGLLGRASLEGMREWWSRLAAWLAIYGGAWAFITVAAVYGPLAVGWLASVNDWGAVTATLGWIGTTIGGLLAANSAQSNGKTKIHSAEPTKTSQAINAVALLGPYVFIAGLLIGVATLLEYVLWNIARDDRQTVAMSADEILFDHWTYMSEPSLLLLAVTSVAIGAALLIMASRVGVNEFSLNAFYRNRLVRCYLGATRDKPSPQRPAGDNNTRNPQRFTNFDECDDLPISDLANQAGQDCGGPFHLVNCALNLGGSSDLSLHTRHSASFTITPTHIGSAHMHIEGSRLSGGYMSHPVDRKEDVVTLGQAISVSGAAASPNMGYHTSPAVAFLLTVFNVRLGWWFPNPTCRKKLPASPLFSLGYLLLELFGIASEKSDYLMVSDGGHFENLGIYELVRRKCKLIVASDAECDPGMKFEGLGTLIRMCEVDFGARIEICSGSLEFDEQTSQSKQRFAIGLIRYLDGTAGLLIYLKACLTGKEDSSIRQYHATHRAFPHESTGDQFYGEDQFESYRRLGRQIADQVIAEGLPAELTPEQRSILDSVWPGLWLEKRAA